MIGVNEKEAGNDIQRYTVRIVQPKRAYVCHSCLHMNGIRWTHVRDWIISVNCGVELKGPSHHGCLSFRIHSRNGFCQSRYRLYKSIRPAEAPGWGSRPLFPIYGRRGNEERDSLSPHFITITAVYVGGMHSSGSGPDHIMNWCGYSHKPSVSVNGLEFCWLLEGPEACQGLCAMLIHYVFCLATGPWPFPKWVLHRVRPLSLYFNFQHPQVLLMPSGSCLYLLPRLPATSIFPSILPSITCFRRQFLRKMWPIQLVFLFLIVRRIFFSSLTLCIIIISITFMQGIYTYIPEKIHVPS